MRNIVVGDIIYIAPHGINLVGGGGRCCWADSKSTAEANIQQEIWHADLQLHMHSVTRIGIRDADDYDGDGPPGRVYDDH